MELSEEEKKAIDIVENIKFKKYEIYIAKKMKNEIRFYQTEEERKAIDIVLNLAKEQQKEIEREEQYIDFYKDLCNKQQKEIENLKKITNTYDSFYANTGNRIVLADNEYFDSGIFIKKYISKDKIRKKIKEYREETMRCQECKDYENANINQRILLAFDELLEEK